MNNKSDKPQGLQGYVQIARRRRRSILIAFAGGMAATLLLAALLPASYRSAGTVLIEQQEMPTDLVKSTVTSYADQRVQVISKRVMTTATLLDIIKRYNLYPREQSRDTREALLKRMREDIGLKMISADVIDPRSGRHDATDFLEGEGDRINAQIVDLEARLAKFKDKNYAKLPDLVQLNMQLLDRNEEELRTQEARLSSLEQQRVYLQAQLVQLKPNSTVFSETGDRIVSSNDRLKMLRSQLAAAKAKYAPDHPDVVTLTREVSGMEAELGEKPDTINDLRRELQETQSQLDDARKRYTAEHPDRVRLEAMVKSLQTDLDAALAASSAPSLATPDTTKPTDADNPAYVQIQATLSGTENDIKSLTGQIGKLQASVHDYETDVAGSPQVEREYHDLTRDLDNARLRYQEIRTKQGEARVAQSLESDRQGERFTLIDPPLPPEEPVSPNRPLIAIAGLILSLALAAAVAMLREVLDTTIRSRDELLQLVGVAPLALIPRIETQADRRTAKRRFHLALGSAAGSACLALVLVHLFYRPLDVLFFSLVQRLGM
jgi:succinoglycan biosynthesis transport protein ExoP